MKKHYAKKAAMAKLKDDPSFLKAEALLRRHYANPKTGSKTFITYIAIRKGIDPGVIEAWSKDCDEAQAMRARWRAARSRKGWRTRRRNKARA